MPTKVTGRIAGRTGVYELIYDHGAITELTPLPAGAPDEGVWLSPGLFDIQINGMFGHDLSCDDLTSEKIVAMEKALEQRGVTQWCPTITTQDTAIVERNLKLIAKTIDSGDAKNIHCVHLEGPYISGEEGYIGVHPRQFVRDPDPEEFDRWQKAAKGRVGLLTLAPERNGACDFARKLVAQGIRVAMGHHGADYDTIRKGAAAGISLSTHLMNGCKPYIHRQHNVIWAQLSLDELWASFIADGFHIPHYTLRALIKAKGVSRSILISDISCLSGLPDGEYVAWNQEVVLQNGGLWVKEKAGELLAGAAKTLDQQVEYLLRHTGFTMNDALTMASLNPAQYFGVKDAFRLVPGRKGAVAVFQWDGADLKTTQVLK